MSAVEGAKYWNDRVKAPLYVQTNNPAEELLRKTLAENRTEVLDYLTQVNTPEDVKNKVSKLLTGYLESCGPTASFNCLVNVGYDISFKIGSHVPQYEELITDYLNNPANYAEFRKLAPHFNPEVVPGNRVPQYYPNAVRAIFGAMASFHDHVSFPFIIDQLKQGRAVQICLNSPGHYLAAVAYDSTDDTIIYKDPWPNRLPDGNGYNRKLSRDFCNKGIRDFVVVYHPPV